VHRKGVNIPETKTVINFLQGIRKEAKKTGAGRKSTSSKKKTNNNQQEGKDRRIRKGGNGLDRTDKKPKANRTNSWGGGMKTRDPLELAQTIYHLPGVRKKEREITNRRIRKPIHHVQVLSSKKVDADRNPLFLQIWKLQKKTASAVGENASGGKSITAFGRRWVGAQYWFWTDSSSTTKHESRKEKGRNE